VLNSRRFEAVQIVGGAAMLMLKKKNAVLMLGAQ
jgi:hypothetical protein